MFFFYMDFYLVSGGGDRVFREGYGGGISKFFSEMIFLKRVCGYRL